MLETTTQLAVGELLDDKYVIEELIGRGGMGAVYRARHKSLDSPRAIKLMRDELAQDEAFVLRFENEAMLAEGVRHPNVVALYDFSSLPNGRKYIVWEYVEGESIRDRLDRGIGFSDAEVLAIVEQIADGLAAAHQQGILHRDVSPDNIMICSSRGSEVRAKLLDFGVAKATGYTASKPSTTGMVFGKVGYASPEQMGLLKDNEQLDARTDIFSLAAVAYAMLTGEPPFDTSSTKNFLHDVMIAPEDEVRRRFLGRLDQRWRSPLARALARNREDRPSTMGELVSEILHAGKTSDAAAERLSRRPGKLLGWLVAAALVVAAIAAVMWFLAVPTSPAPPPSTDVLVAGTPDPLLRVDTAALDAEYATTTLAVVEPDEIEPAREESGGPDAGTLTVERDNPVSEERPEGDELPAPPAGDILEEDAHVEETVTGTAGEVAPTGGTAPNPPVEEPEPAEPDPEPVLADRAPKKVADVPPVYPEILKSMGREGLVVLEAIITTEGNVDIVRVLESSHRLFEKPAIEAAERWKYEPAIVDGELAAFEMTLTVQFQFR